MKTLVKAVAVAAGLAMLPVTAGAWWDDNDGYGRGDFRGDGYGRGYGDGYTDGDFDGDGEFDANMNFNMKGKGRGRGRGTGRGYSDYRGYNDYRGNSDWRSNSYGDRWGGGYYGRPYGPPPGYYAPQAPQGAPAPAGPAQ